MGLPPPLASQHSEKVGYYGVNTASKFGCGDLQEANNELSMRAAKLSSLETKFSCSVPVLETTPPFVVSRLALSLKSMDNGTVT